MSYFNETQISDGNNTANVEVSKELNTRDNQLIEVCNKMLDSLEILNEKLDNLSLLGQGRVGTNPYTVSSDGAVNDLRLSGSGALVTQNSHGIYTEAALRGNLFMASTTAAVSVNAGPSTTVSSLAFWNPPTSGVNAVFLEVMQPYIVTGPASNSATYMAMSPAITLPTITTSLTIQNAMPSASLSGSQIRAFTAGTLTVTPVIVRHLFNNGAVYGIRDEIKGALIVPPGWAAVIQTGVAYSAFLFAMWEEIPV